MKLISIERKKGELNLPLIYLMVVGLCVFFVYVLYLMNRLPQFPCVFKTITGHPCPSCGSTRVLLNLFNLDIYSAFLSNPFVSLIGIAFIAWVIYGFHMFFSGKKINVTLTKKEGRFLRFGFITLFILNWIYLIFFL